jgi:hypothetical protein
MSVVVNGSAQGIKLGGTTYFVWWGDIESGGAQSVATVDGAVIAFASADACAAWAVSVGLQAAQDVDTDVVDCDEVGAQLDERDLQADFDASSCLDVINMSIDIAASLGIKWDPRDAETYDHLFATSVPWFFGDDFVAPEWSAQEREDARTMVRRSVDVLTSALRA